MGTMALTVAEVPIMMVLTLKERMYPEDAVLRVANSMGEQLLYLGIQSFFIYSYL